MEAILINLAFKALRLIFGWLFKLVRPVLRSLVRAVWPVIRLLLIVAGVIAAVLVLRQVLARRGRLAAP